MLIEVCDIPGLLEDGGALGDPATAVVACTSDDAVAAGLAGHACVLVLAFDDITHPDRRRAFKPGHARQIARFVEAAAEGDPPAKRIVAACDGGMSRSAAVAAALRLRFGQDDTPIWGDPAYRPNPLVFRTLLEALHIDMPPGAIEERLARSERVAAQRW